MRSRRYMGWTVSGRWPPSARHALLGLAGLPPLRDLQALKQRLSGSRGYGSLADALVEAANAGHHAILGNELSVASTDRVVDVSPWKIAVPEKSMGAHCPAPPSTAEPSVTCQGPHAPRSPAAHLRSRTQRLGNATVPSLGTAVHDRSAPPRSRGALTPAHASTPRVAQVGRG